MRHSLQVFLLCAFAVLTGCGEKDGKSYKSVSVRIKNATTATLTAHYKTVDWDLFKDSLGSKTEDIDSLNEITITTYYDSVPDIQITGPGYDHWFNALVYTNDRIVVNQSEITAGSG